MDKENQTAAAKHQLPPSVQVMQMLGGAFISQAVYVAAKLGIADLLADEAKETKYLAEQTGTHEPSLYRLLRALASVGAFIETSPQFFANTPASETLRSDAPDSMRDLVLWIGEEPHWRVYSDLLYSIRTGKPAWDRVHGEPVFPYLFETNKELGDIFNRAMTSLSHQAIPGILAAYDFSDISTLADIAGGYGHLLAAVLQKYPSMKGVLFDLGVVLEGAPAMLESYGVRDRVELVEGNFFSEIPVRADAYLLKHIIHDWLDNDCRKILGNIRNVMPDNARILIVEAVIPQGNEPDIGKIIDLEMLIAPGGKERTAKEFKTLIVSAGLKLSRIIPTLGPVCIVEATGFTPGSR